MIQLPTYTFLYAPAGSGKTTLADLLVDQDANLGVMSFATPLREALVSTFYFDTEEPPDLLSQEAKLSLIPGTTISHRQFLISYSNFIKEQTNPMIFGDLAKRRCAKFSNMFARFVFDDTRTMGDIAPFVNAYGRDECLLVYIERRNLVLSLANDVGSKEDLRLLPGIRKVSIYNNEEPERMLDRLASALGATASSFPSIEQGEPTLEAEPSLDDL